MLNSQTAFCMFVEMPQQIYVFWDNKVLDGPNSFYTNFCNLSMFNLFSNQVINGHH